MKLRNDKMMLKFPKVKVSILERNFIHQICLLHNNWNVFIVSPQKKLSTIQTPTKVTIKIRIMCKKLSE